MPGNPPQTPTGGESPDFNQDQPASEFQSHLRRFIQATKPYLTPEPEDLPAAQFIAHRNAVLDAVESEEVVGDTALAWQALHQNPATQQVAHLLMLEVSAFPAATEVSEGASKGDRSPRSLKKRLLGIGGIIVDSLRDILQLSERAKAVWKIFGELLDIFKGD